MTIEEMKKRIKEIESLRAKLAEERDSLQDIITEENEKTKAIELSSYVGKCYTKTNLLSTRFSYKEQDLQFFKILSIEKNNRSAKCVAIYKDLNSLTISKKVLYLWSSAQISLMDNGPKLIEHFTEIDEDEFDRVFENAYRTIKGEN